MMQREREKGWAVEAGKQSGRATKIWTNAVVVVLAAVLCNVLWGSAIPAIKIGYRCFAITDSISTKILFAGIRFFAAGVMVLLVYVCMNRKLPKIKHKNMPSVLVLALVQTTIQYIFFYIGVANCAAANGSIVNSCTTFISVVMAHFIYKDDKINRNKAVGCVIGFAGVLLVTFGQGAEASAKVSVLGEGFVVIASFAFCIAGILSKSITQKEDSVAVTGYNLSIGGAVLIVIGLVSGGHFEQVSASGVGVLAYLSFLSAVAFTLWTILLKFNKIGRICIYNFVVPVAGIFLAGIILGENVWQIKYFAALLLVCAGIIIVNRPLKKERQQAE